MSYVSTIAPGGKVRLADIDPDYHDALSKEEGEELTRQLGEELNELEDLLYEAGQNGLLIVLQGLDTSGKDGTIRHLLGYLNGQNGTVVPFKVPTPIEIAHDFLWRVHVATPGKGGVTIFNRSHYEDVLVVRVHELVPEAVWKPRYEHINQFEKLLVDHGTIVLKFMLHISKGEQEKRLLARENEVEKAWKLSVGDWKEREFWDDYTKAYEDVLSKCSTEYAPWHVVSANHKWFRNLAVTQKIVQALRDYKKPWIQRLEKVGDQAKAEIAEWRKTQA